MGVNSLPWYYAPEINPAANSLMLSGDEWHHAHHVLRLAEGEHLIFFDGRGLCAEGVLTRTGKNEGQAELLRNVAGEFADPRPYKISIGIAPTKQIDRTEFAVEKLVEIGVHQICFLDTDHGERTHLRMDRMEKLVVSAGKQSRKIYLPSLMDFISLSDLIHKYHAEGNAQVLACHLHPQAQPLSNTCKAARDVLVLIGPEGGFSDPEINQMMDLNVQLVTLGPHRLRVETAAIAACVTIHTLNEINTHK
jgi:16S rRNA (uracil1498-N3)-methyltransferase